MPKSLLPSPIPLLILGSGPAGYTCAIYAARAMRYPVLISGIEEGGQLMVTQDVENYPGFAAPIGGPWLMEQMKAQAQAVGTTLISDHIVEAQLRQRPFLLTGDSGTLYTCETLVIATGAKAKWLGLPSEEKYKGYGVSACATCDGFFYRDKEVMVIGGGNTAVEEALYLANIARKVTLVHRRRSLRAEAILQQRLHQNPKIHCLWEKEIQEIHGTDSPLQVTHVSLKEARTGEIQTYPTEGIFIAIGHQPATELFKDQLRFHDQHYIWTAPDSTQTSCEGVFAAGDVTDNVYRQAVTAAGMGCMAALEAERFLERRILNS